MIAVCGLLFSLFSFVYLYVFQRDVLEALHFSLAHGKTTFAPMASALVITLILLLLRWGVNSLLGLKGRVRALAYVPSFLVLCALTDVGRGVYISDYHTPWTWLLPLLVLLFVGIGYWLRGVFRVQLNHEGSLWGLVNSNLAILLGLCLLTVCVGSTNRQFHHELEAEHYLRAGEYDKVLRVGEKSLEASRTLTTSCLLIRSITVPTGCSLKRILCTRSVIRTIPFITCWEHVHIREKTVWYSCGTSATREPENIPRWTITFLPCCLKRNWTVSHRPFPISICRKIPCRVITGKL